MKRIALALLAACGSDAASPDAPSAPIDAPSPSRPDAPLDPGDPDAAPPAAEIDPSTMDRKLLFGYQGWFLCPGDGAPPDRWVHWFREQASPATVTVDMWPDTRELGESERCDTGFTLPDGSPAYVYSAWNPVTVDRHFRWMREHGIDGVLLQRFVSELGDPAFLAARDQVTANVRAAAEAHGRVFAIMYDISGADAGALTEALQADWRHLVDDLGVTASPRYLHHRGRPALGLWGFGFPDRPGTPEQAAQVIAWFHGEEVTLVGGVTREWRDDALWRDTLYGYDVLSPWTVGAFVDDAGADVYRDRLAGDLADLTARGRDYLPVVFPGFSWHNLNDGPLNQIPRRGGRLFWRQMYNAADAGSTMVFGAMFDEVDEGTAMFKIAPTAAAQPVEVPFVPLDIDGEALPADFYLRLAGAAGRALRGEIPLTPARPID